MKIILRLVLFSICFFHLPSLKLNAQGNNSASWSAKFEFQKSFIENKGQFIIPNSFGNLSPVLFAVDHGGTKIYFTKNGVTYAFLETSKKPKDAREIERERREEFESVEAHIRHEREEHELKVKADQVTMLWQNANPNVIVESSDLTPDYHNYYFKQTNGEYKSVSNVKGYKKITYKNIYPNIDVEYVFSDKVGLKYSLTLYPGADPSLIKMLYDKHVSLNSDGEIHIDTKLGDVIDHAPLSFYQQNNESVITSRFIKNGKTVSFQLGNYDNTKTVVIDPWTQTPVFNTNWQCIWECEKDGAGNVYVIGGVTPLQLLKYNSTGTLQWTYNTPYDTTSWLGTFATDNAGNSYVTRVSTSGIHKVNTAGAVVWNNNGGGTLGNSDEYWNIAFNCDQTKLIVGGTAGAFAIPPVLKGTIFDINTSNGAVLSTKTVAYGAAAAFPPSTQEVRSITPCGNGKYYFLTLDTIGYINQNFSLCSTSPPTYKTSSTHAFSYKCENYRRDNTGIMAIRADLNFVYTHNGTTLFKRSLTTAAIIASVAIPGGAATTSLGKKVVSCSGIDIDANGNIYVGSTNAVTKFSPALVQLATVAVPFNVYDVHVSTGGDVIACGTTGNSSTTGSRTGYIQSISSLSAGSILSLTCCDLQVCQPPNICSTSAAFNLTAATPGGTWSGPGITNASTGTFNPGTAGVGTHVISYSLACGVGTTTINVSACGTVSLCVNSGSLNVIGGTSTYTWASTTTSVNCSGCFGGICTPFCPGVTVPTWTASGTTVAAPSSTVFPIKVKDLASGITYTFTTLASIPPCSTPTCPTLSLSVTSQTNVNCFGANTGSASVNTTGGTGPYTYTWSPGNLSGSNQTALTAGTYTVAIKDVNNCSGSGTLSISQPTAALNAVITATSSAGCGASNGGATVTTSGGTPSYTYSWAPSGATNASATNLSAGNNTVIVTDSKGCTASAIANISSTGGPTLSVNSQTNVNCFSASTGTASILATGGTGPYNYTWTPGNLSGPSQTALTAGTYTINVKDANQCLSSTTLTITQPTAGVIGVISATAAAGCGASTGGATVTVNGGTPSYSYSWVPSGGTTAGVSNLSSGSNSVIVTDAKGCSVTVIANITTAGGPTLSVSSQTNVNCFGANAGSATVIGNGGTGPYSYTWSPGNLNGASQTGLTAGTYTVNIKDVNLCAGSGTVLITQPTSSITSNFSNTVAASCGLSNGSASVTASGGTPSYTYSWSPNGGSLASVSNLSSGNNSVTITDSKGCNVTSVISINSTGGPTLSIVSQTSVSCFGANTGTATINGNGGTAPYTYTWSPGNLNGASQSNLSAGIYTVNIKDATNCVGSGTIAIAQPTSGISGNISNTPTGCGASLGSATVTASGGTPNYTYSWSPSGGTTSIATGLAVGNYSVQISDSKGCSTTLVTTINNTGGGPSLSISSQTNLICNGATNGAASISVTGGSGVYTYTWMPTGGNTSNANSLAAGIYTVIVKDGSTCVSTITVNISQPPPIALTVSTTPASCGNFDGTASVNVTGGNNPITILWSVNSNSTTITGLSAGTYSVLITDASSCTASTSCYVSSSGSIAVNASGATTIYQGESTGLEVTIPSGATVVWTPTTSLSCITCTATTASPTVTTTYTVIAYSGGCTGSDTVTVYVDIKCGELFVPSAFSPNDDGQNDVLYVMGTCIVGMDFVIFDRWGEKVFESTDPAFGWDGTFNGKKMTPAAFAYYLKAIIKGEEVIKKGSVSIVK